jgi:hypothetical protein
METEIKQTHTLGMPYPLNQSEIDQGWDTLITKYWLQCTECNCWRSVPKAVRDKEVAATGRGWTCGMASRWRDVRNPRRPANHLMHCCLLKRRAELCCGGCVVVWCFQDACCEMPSDFLDAGQRDLYVPTVPAGFVREVVIDFQSHVRDVVYHYFEEKHVGRAEPRMVQRTALLRAYMRKEGVGAAETVEGFMRSHPHVRVEFVHFNFRTDAPASKGVAPKGKAAAKTPKAAPKAAAKAPKAAKAAPKKGTLLQRDRFAAFAKADKEKGRLLSSRLARVRHKELADDPHGTDDGDAKAQRRWKFPLTGGALKCNLCQRWRNVPTKVMNTVRSPFHRRRLDDVMCSPPHPFVSRCFVPASAVLTRRGV